MNFEFVFLGFLIALGIGGKFYVQYQVSSPMKEILYCLLILYFLAIVGYLLGFLGW